MQHTVLRRHSVEPGGLEHSFFPSASLVAKQTKNKPKNEVSPKSFFYFFFQKDFNEIVKYLLVMQFLFVFVLQEGGNCKVTVRIVVGGKLLNPCTIKQH